MATRQLRPGLPSSGLSGGDTSWGGTPFGRTEDELRYVSEWDQRYQSFSTQWEKQHPTTPSVSDGVGWEAPATPPPRRTQSIFDPQRIAQQDLPSMSPMRVDMPRKLPVLEESLTSGRLPTLPPVTRAAEAAAPMGQYGDPMRLTPQQLAEHPEYLEPMGPLKNMVYEVASFIERGSMAVGQLFWKTLKRSLEKGAEVETASQEMWNNLERWAPNDVYVEPIDPRLRESADNLGEKAQEYVEKQIEYYSHPEKHGTFSKEVLPRREQALAAAYAHSNALGRATAIAHAGTDTMLYLTTVAIMAKVGTPAPLPGLTVAKGALKPGMLGAPGKPALGPQAPTWLKQKYHDMTRAIEATTNMPRPQYEATMQRMQRIAAHGALTTPGEIEDRLESAAWRIGYNITPVLANATGAVAWSARATDVLLNTFLTSPHYFAAWQEYGFGEEFWNFAAPQMAMDVVMAWGTRGLDDTIRNRAFTSHVDSIVKDHKEFTGKDVSREGVAKSLNQLQSEMVKLAKLELLDIPDRVAREGPRYGVAVPRGVTEGDIKAGARGMVTPAREIIRRGPIEPAKVEEAKKTLVLPEELSTGSPVTHTKFGEGVVTGKKLRADGTLTVKFDDKSRKVKLETLSVSQRVEPERVEPPVEVEKVEPPKVKGDFKSWDEVAKLEPGTKLYHPKAGIITFQKVHTGLAHGDVSLIRDSDQAKIAIPWGELSRAPAEATKPLEAPSIERSPSDRTIIVGNKDHRAVPEADYLPDRAFAEILKVLPPYLGIRDYNSKDETFILNEQTRAEWDKGRVAIDDAIKFLEAAEQGVKAKPEKGATGMEDRDRILDNLKEILGYKTYSEKALADSFEVLREGQKVFNRLADTAAVLPQPAARSTEKEAPAKPTIKTAPSSDKGTLAAPEVRDQLTTKHKANLGPIGKLLREKQIPEGDRAVILRSIRDVQAEYEKYGIELKLEFKDLMDQGQDQLVKALTQAKKDHGVKGPVNYEEDIQFLRGSLQLEKANATMVKAAIELNFSAGGPKTLPTIHELGHLYMHMVRLGNPEKYKEIREFVKLSDPKATQRQVDEVIVKIMTDAAIMEGTKIGREQLARTKEGVELPAWAKLARDFKNWILDFMEEVRKKGSMTLANKLYSDQHPLGVNIRNFARGNWGDVLSEYRQRLETESPKVKPELRYMAHPEGRVTTLPGTISMREWPEKTSSHTRITQPRFQVVHKPRSDNPWVVIDQVRPDMVLGSFKTNQEAWNRIVDLTEKQKDRNILGLKPETVTVTQEARAEYIEDWARQGSTPQILDMLGIRVNVDGTISYSKQLADRALIIMQEAEMRDTREIAGPPQILSGLELPPQPRTPPKKAYQGFRGDYWAHKMPSEDREIAHELANRFWADDRKDAKSIIQRLSYLSDKEETGWPIKPGERYDYETLNTENERLSNIYKNLSSKYAPMFYVGLREIAEDKLPNQAPRDQMINTLVKNAKGEELRETEIVPLIKDKYPDPKDVVPKEFVMNELKKYDAVLNDLEIRVETASNRDRVEDIIEARRAIIDAETGEKTTTQRKKLRSLRIIERDLEEELNAPLLAFDGKWMGTKTDQARTVTEAVAREFHEGTWREENSLVRYLGTKGVAPPNSLYFSDRDWTLWANERAAWDVSDWNNWIRRVGYDWAHYERESYLWTNFKPPQEVLEKHPDLMRVAEQTKEMREDLKQINREADPKLGETREQIKSLEKEIEKVRQEVEKDIEKQKIASALGIDQIIRPIPNQELHESVQRVSPTARYLPWDRMPRWNEEVYGVAELVWPMRLRETDLPANYTIEKSLNIREGRYDHFVKSPQGQTFGKGSSRTEAMEKFYKSFDEMLPRPLDPQFGHFRSPNELMFVRFSTRAKDNGENVLVIEQMQSDVHALRHQPVYGHTTRYAGETEREIEKVPLKDAEGKTVKAFGVSEVPISGPFTLKPMPFEKTWPELGMKWALRFAAENNIKEIYWTTGKQQSQIVGGRTAESEKFPIIYDQAIPKAISKLSNRNEWNLAIERGSWVEDSNLRLAGFDTGSQVHKEPFYKVVLDDKVVNDLLYRGVELFDFEGRDKVDQTIKDLLGKARAQTPKKKVVKESEITPKSRKEQEPTLGERFSKEQRSWIKAEQEKLRKALRDPKESPYGPIRPEYKDSIEAVLKGVDWMTATKRTTKKMERLAQVKKLIEKEEYHILPANVVKDLEILDKKPLSEFTWKEVESMFTAVKSLLHKNKLKQQLTIGKRYHALQQKVNESVALVRAAHKLTDDIDRFQHEISSVDVRTKPGKLKTLTSVWKEASYMPETLSIFLQGGEAGAVKEILYDGIHKGYTDRYGLYYKAQDHARKVIEETIGDVDKIMPWSKYFVTRKRKLDRIKVDLEHHEKTGKPRKIELTRDERMELYAHSKVLYNRRSVLHKDGGIRFLGQEDRPPFVLSPKDLEKIIDGMPREETALVDKLFEFMNTTLRDAGNAVSLKLDGFHVFREDAYFPANRWSKDIIEPMMPEGKLPRQNFNRQVLEDLGILQDREYGVAPILMRGFFGTYFKYLDEMTRYVGFAEPLRNANMLMNDKSFIGSMVEAGRMNYYDTLKNYIQDVEGNVRDMTPIEKFAKRLLDPIHRNILGFNIGVMLKQPTSYLAAGTEIDLKYLTAALGTRTSHVKAEMKKYSPQNRYRLEGKITREMGELGEVGQILQFFTGKTFASRKVTAGIQYFDFLTVGRIWNAVKMETKMNHPDLTGDAFFKKVAERHEEIVNRTQPTYLPHTRSEIGRSPHPFVRMFAPFHTQRNKNYNIMMKSLWQFQKGPKTFDNWAQLMKMVGLMMIASPMYLSTVDELRNKAYGRHVQQTTSRKIVRHFSHILSSAYGVAPLFDSVYGRVFEDTRRGYDISLSDPYSSTILEGVVAASSILEFLKAAGNKEVYETGYKEGQQAWETKLMKAMDDSLAFAGKLTGLPYYNVKRLAGGLIQNAHPDFVIKVDSVTRNPQSSYYYNKMWEQLEMGDTKGAGRTLNVLIHDFNISRADLEQSAKRRGISKSMFDDAVKLGRQQQR